MFHLLNWIPGCRGPQYIRYSNEKSPPVINIPDHRPTFPLVPPPPAHPIPENRYQRRLIDEDFPQVFRAVSNNAKLVKRYPMHEETFEVTPSPPRDASPQPRVSRRENSRRTRGSEDNFSSRATDGSHSSAAARRRIADETLAAIERGEIQLQGSTYRFRDVISYSINNTIYFSPESILADWSTSPPDSPVTAVPAKLELCEGSTLQRARALLQELNNTGTADDGAGPARVGVLSFASATKPGGGFLNGAQAQEESLARASTLYASLITETASRFYDLHKKDRRGGFYSHAMIFSPSAIVLRDDAGTWVPPHQIDVVTSAAVNAGVVRERAREDSDSDTAARIEGVMRERMARILFLFEQQGIRNIVLGSFGTGVFRNDISMIADIWFDLLAEEGARFMHSFDRVVFGIIDTRTVERFKAVFESRIEGQNSLTWDSETSSATSRSVLRVVE